MKFFKNILSLSIIVFILFALFIEFGGKYLLVTEDKKMITWSVRINIKLPKNFIDFYNTAYPNSISQNSWNLVVNNLLNSKSTTKECPCREMAFRIFPTLEIQNKNSLDYIFVTRYLEHNYSQKDCLNFNFSNFDFLENRKGIEQVSKSLFNKQVKNLRPIEMAEIIALHENPVKNNRNRNLEKTIIRSEYLYHLYLQNLNK